jgi:hypothetical protein
VKLDISSEYVRLTTDAFADAAEKHPRIIKHCEIANLWFLFIMPSCPLLAPSMEAALLH